MAKYLKYDEISGQLTDKNNLFVTTLTGYTGIEIDQNESSNVDDFIKLKNAGFTAEDIIAIKKANL